MQFLKGKVAFTGNPNLDIGPELERERIRKEFRIPSNKKVVLLLPINLTYWPGEWPWFYLAEAGLKQIRQLFRAVRNEGWSFLANYWHWAILGWNDDNLVKAIRQFCDKNNAMLIVKARKKDALRKGTKELADIAIYDESYYPSTVYKLMQVADLCIHFYSTAALEAAYFGTSSLCINRPNLDIAMHRLWRTNRIGGAFNFPGVNKWMSIPSAIRALPFISLENFAMDPKARNRYVNKYLGSSDELASRKILEIVDNLLDA
jgi:hypothetical protein